ncbi:MAG TPA: aldehyde dehydrogenase family protein [Candidatus Dormibacteraeota bacterium]|nr:aldehyde dehydrogenase family protein [Candidatus Dormibacteraeota bacterium]
MLTITNPATGAVIAELETDTPASIAARVVRARAAQPAWAAMPVGERVAALRRFRDRLQADVEPLARLLSEEVGKPISQARSEIANTQRLEFFLEHAAAVLADENVFADAGGSERIGWEPLGVVANVSAWNYPYFVAANVVPPALLAGNAVLYKPSEFASRTGLAMTERLHAAGVPADVIQPVIGAGEVGAALVAADIDAVYFTGSYPTGVRIAQATAPRLLRVQLELGGKDPIYVCDDAPVAETAAAVADGTFYNTGQSCCAVERVYVHRAIAAPFIDAFAATVRGFVVGDPLDERTYIGPLARRAQLAVLAAQVADARSKGATVLTGGGRLEGAGNYFAPTVLTNVDHSMAVMRDESFGPVIGIQVVGDDAEAAALMRDTEYGLTAGIYTPDRARAERLLAGMPTGTVYWNCCDRVTPRLPWSGRHHSGIGLTLSTHGIRAFAQPKAWHLRG